MEVLNFCLEVQSRGLFVGLELDWIGVGVGIGIVGCSNWGLGIDRVKLDSCWFACFACLLAWFGLFGDEIVG